MIASDTTYRAIFYGSPIGIAHFDATGTATAVNEHLLQLLGLREDQLVGMRLADAIEAPYIAHSVQVVLLGESARGAFQYVAPDRHGVRTLAVDFVPLFSSGGSVSGGIGILHDVTERTAAEEKLRETLKERETALREVHHRAKNNLQVITSLLDLQSAYVEDESFLQILKEMQDRIWSIALVHEMLYRSEGLARIDVHAYVEALIADLFDSYGPKVAPIEQRVSVEPISFPIETAVPFGLMIHELISHSLNDALPEGTGAAIEVSLCALEDDRFELVVKNRGSGKQPALEAPRGGSFGLRLVEALARQLQGEMELDWESATYARIRFRDIAAGKRREQR